MKKKKMNRWVLFARTLIVAGLFGGVIGFASAVGTVFVDVKALTAQAEQWMITNVNVLMIAGSVLMAAVVLLLFGKGYRRYAAGLQAEDDARVESGDMLMGIGIGLSTLGFVWNFFLMGTALPSAELGIAFLVVFLVCSIGICVLQVKLIDWSKKLMPEKRGDATRMDFQREWLESCDEAEQYAIFKACYKTHMVMQKVILALMVVCFLTRMLLGAGTAALGMVSLIWAVQTVVYTVFSARYSSKKLN